MAGVFIFIAAVFDYLDGMVARLLDARSELGKQLDSLADVVSFGVAPGIMMFPMMKKISLLTVRKFLCPRKKTRPCCRGRN